MGVLLNHHILNRKLLHSRPPHDRLRHFYTFLIGNVTVSERVSAERMGESPENRQPVRETLHTAPCPWNDPAVYATEHCTGKRRKGRIELGIGASMVGQYLIREAYCRGMRTTAQEPQAKLSRV
jgi:hypothetical protein